MEIDLRALEAAIVSAEIFNIRDYQNRRELAKLSEQAVEETSNAFVGVFGCYPVWPDFSAANAFHGVPSDKEPA